MDIPKTTIQKLLEACKSGWLRYLVGAIIGAAAAAGLISVTGCTLSVDPAAIRYIIANPIDSTGK